MKNLVIIACNSVKKYKPKINRLYGRIEHKSSTANVYKCIIFQTDIENNEQNLDTIKGTLSDVFKIISSFNEIIPKQFSVICTEATASGLQELSKKNKIMCTISRHSSL